MRATRKRTPRFDVCEGRLMPTLVFVLNGASFDAARPNSLTANAAAVLHKAGNQVVQLSNARINTASAYDALARRIVSLAHGRDVGLVGFSAGGALALRLSATPGLKVDAVLDDYGVPDVGSYLARHRVDRMFRPISGIAPFRASLVSRLSGPVATSAHVVAAFGRFDPNVRADASASDLLRDDPAADIYTYPGGHGVPITASPSALEDFLTHL